ncbi:MAG: NRAMP family divalent metal transporter [Sumerlaeia bacterium]
MTQPALLQNPNHRMSSRSILRSLGPGILLAGAAIGGSHIYQSTVAGADFGWGLLWIVILVNVLKFPFFEYVYRYNISTQETMLHGYKERSVGIFWTATIILFISGILNIVALCIGTGALLQGLINRSFVTLPVATAAVALSCLAIVLIGRYKALDLVAKVVVSLLSVCTIWAFILAFAKGAEGDSTLPEPIIFQWANVPFMLALMGWMPLPLDITVWPSLWNCEKKEEAGEFPHRGEAYVDLHLGYWAAALLAVFFLGLGALVLYQTPVEINKSNAVAFSSQFIGLYGSIFGESAKWLIGIAAVTALYSSALTCVDGYSRTMFHCLREFAPNSITPKNKYSIMGAFAVFYCAVSIIIASYFVKSVGSMIDLATIIAFLTAPIMALANILVVESNVCPKSARPGWGMRIFAYTGFLFLLVFASLYIVTLFQ